MNEWTTKQTNKWSVYRCVSRQIKVCNSIKYNVTQTVSKDLMSEWMNKQMIEIMD